MEISMLAVTQVAQPASCRSVLAAFIALEEKKVLELTRSAEAHDLRCNHCGAKVLAAKFYDTRGRFYCDPDCWEGDDA
jgi:hypothetical protein